MGNGGNGVWGNGGNKQNKINLFYFGMMEMRSGLSLKQERNGKTMRIMLTNSRIKSRKTAQRDRRWFRLSASSASRRCVYCERVVILLVYSRLKFLRIMLTNS